MGWSSGDEVFDPVCRVVVEATSWGTVSEEAATKILTALIQALQDRSWDTEGESLHQFRSHEFVVAAFRAQGVELSDDDDREGP